MAPTYPAAKGPDDPEETESQKAMREQEKKLMDTLGTIADVKRTADRSRRVLSSDLLALAIERSMRRA
jgi:hypothetical protein